MPEEFSPITSQDALDAIISKRVKEEKELREEVETLKAQIEAKDKEIATLQKEHAVQWELARRGLDSPLTAGKVETIKSLIDLGSETSPAEQLDSLSKRVPELFQVPQGTGSGYFSKQPALDRERELTREEVEKMSPQDIDSRWDSVRKFMAGERG